MHFFQSQSLQVFVLLHHHQPGSSVQHYEFLSVLHYPAQHAHLSATYF
ncbi:uncharacterized protein METZ01_LOCUS173634 [marine metagenome]|uniref:Uncharacterized protein n=1 Tax=marine metagenome TaxID=408172 RepID=A0A382C405_9ZZZZ